MKVEIPATFHGLKNFLKQTQVIEIIFLIFLCGISLFFRFYNFPNRAGWVHDIGRDFLAGYLISHQGQNTVYGHWNSGINFVYPAYYYYFIAGLELLSDQPEYIIGVFTFFQAMAVILIYLISKKLFSKLTAGSTALLYALSPFMIGLSLFPLSAHFGLLLFLVSLFFLVYFLENRKISFLFLSVFMLILAATVFYGAMLFFPIYGLLIGLKLLKDKKFFHIIGWFVLFAVSCFFVLFSPLILRGHLLNLIGLNRESSLGIQRSIYPADLYKEAKNQLIKILPKHLELAVIFYMGVVGYFLLRKKSIYFLVLFGVTFSYHLILFCLKQERLSHYMGLLYPGYFFAIGSILQLALKLRNKPTFLFLIILLASIFFTGAYEFKNLLTTSQGKNLQTYQKLASILLQTYPTYGFTLTDKYPPLFWSSRSLWYFLRENQPFLLADGHDQIDSAAVRIINICEEDMNEMNNFCKVLSRQQKWHPIGKVRIDGDPTQFNLYLK